MSGEFNNTFSVMPMSTAVELNPGEVYEGVLTVVNPNSSTRDFSYRAEVAPYTVSGENYEADLLSESDRTAITKWMTIEEPTGVVAPNETREIKYTIEVPYNAPAGGQYAVITVSSNEADDNSDYMSVKNVFEIASVIYASVAGETVHDGKVTRNSIPGFVTSTPVKLSSSIVNDGNVHEKATYTMTAMDALSGQVFYPLTEGEGIMAEMIMPETTRNLEWEVQNLPMVGIVNVSQTISYLGQTSYEERTVVICPIWFMVLVLAVVCGIVAGIVMMVRKRRRRPGPIL